MFREKIFRNGIDLYKISRNPEISHPCSSIKPVFSFEKVKYNLLSITSPLSSPIIRGMSICGAVPKPPVVMGTPSPGTYCSSYQTSPAISFSVIRSWSKTVKSKVTPSFEQSSRGISLVKMKGTYKYKMSKISNFLCNHFVWVKNISKLLGGNFLTQNEWKSNSVTYKIKCHEKNCLHIFSQKK